VQPGSQQAAATSGQLASSAPSAPSDVLAGLAQAKSLLDEASTNASAALKEILTWQSEIEPLCDQVVAQPTATGGEDGEADETAELFDRLAYVMRRDKTSPAELHDAVGQIDSLRTKVDDLMNQSSPAALPALDMADVGELHAMCKQSKEDWQRDVEQGLAIKHLLELGVTTPSSPASPTTIGSKIKDADAKAAITRLDRQMVREEKEEAAREAREAELRRQDELKQQQEGELLAQATAPEVKALLAPFLEPRTIQPSLSGTFSIRWLSTDEKKPMSLDKLVSIGVLDESVIGRQKLALVGGHRKLPEPKWSIASQPNHWTGEDEERLKQAQQMLRDYGPILVKAGYLSE
jgi:hypothetical protein